MNAGILSWARRNETGRLPQKPNAPLHPCPVLRLPSPGYQASVWAFPVYGDLRRGKIEILKKVFLSCYCSCPGPPLFIHYSAVIEYPLSASPWASAGRQVLGGGCVWPLHTPAPACLLPACLWGWGRGAGRAPPRAGREKPTQPPILGSPFQLHGGGQSGLSSWELCTENLCHTVKTCISLLAPR